MFVLLNADPMSRLANATKQNIFYVYERIFPSSVPW